MHNPSHQLAAANTPTPAPFHFASWNILAQSYAFSHAVTDAAALKWPERGQRIIDQLMKSQPQPDILALQEVDHFHDTYQRRLQELGYEMKYAPRNGRMIEEEIETPPPPTIPISSSSSTSSSDSVAPPAVTAASPHDWYHRSPSKRSKPDGILLAWRKDRFRLAAAGSSSNSTSTHPSTFIVDYDDLAFAEDEVRQFDHGQLIDRSTLSATSQQREIKFLRHNIGLFAFLEPIESGPTVLVANTHLYWNPMHEDVKIKQIQYFLARIEIECRKRLYPNETIQDITASLNQIKLNPSSALSSSLSTFPSIAAFPFILAGDFNSSPLSKLYRYVTNGIYERKETLLVTPSSSSSSSSSTTTATDSTSASTTVTSTTNGQTAPIKFIADSDLSKVAKWLRSIGIDCSSYTDLEKKARGHVGMFTTAIQEKRIILTRSMRLIERRGCPPFFLLRNENLEAAFAALIQHYGLQFEEKLFYSRCIFCNSGFDNYPAAYFIGGLDDKGVMHEKHEPFIDIPRGFINAGYRDDDGKLLTFTRCRDEARPYTKCGKLFWWGARSGGALEMFASRMDAALSKQHQENEGLVAPHHHAESTTTTNSSTLESKESPEQPRRVITPERQVELRLACEIARRDLDQSSSPESPSSSQLMHNLPLRSAYVEIETEEPPFTNLTSTFNDTLDYVFYYPGPIRNSSDVSLASTTSDTQEPIPPSTYSQLRLSGVRPILDNSGLDLMTLQKTLGSQRKLVQQQREKNDVEEEEDDDADEEESKDVDVESTNSSLSLVLPNLIWPSDHLLLQATFTLQ